MGSANPTGLGNSNYVSLINTTNGSGTQTALFSLFYVRQYTVTEPTVSTGNEQVALPSSGTWVSPANSNVIDTVYNAGWGDGTNGASTAFSATIGNVSSNATVAFQMRTASSIAALTSASYITLGLANSGTNFSLTKSHMDSLGVPTGSNRYIQIQASFNQTNGINPFLDSFTISYATDNTPPETNASAIAMYQANGGTNIPSNGWDTSTTPYFTWTAGADSQSGIQGYCLYLGTDANGNPATDKGLLGTSPAPTTGSTCQFIVPSNNVDFANTSYHGSAWLSSSTSPYYINIAAIDTADNIDSTFAQFQFLFDTTAPTNPVSLLLPSSYVSSKAVTMDWPISGVGAATDSIAGIAGYQYKIGSNGTWYGANHNGHQDMTDIFSPATNSYTFTSTYDYSALNEGGNIIYFRTWNNAGIVSSTTLTGILNVNTVAPSQPQNLAVTPANNTTNVYGFSWSAPTTFTGNVANITYCYSVNTLPSVSTCTFTGKGVTSLATSAYATQPGTNTFYVVAEDEAGNINYGVYASIPFTYSGTAPGIPANVALSDSTWKLVLSWSTPGNIGAGIKSYRIFRATTNASCASSPGTFTNIGSTAGTSYADTGLTQQTYYYCAESCDSANSCSAPSTTVADYPTGKFTIPANMISNPTMSSLQTKSAVISWATDRDSDSKVQYGTASGQYFPEEVADSTQTTTHILTLNNLSPGTTYFYRVNWTDTDGNTGYSTEQTFSTAPAPTVQDVVVSNINLDRAIIQFTANGASGVTIYYGASSGFGQTQHLSTATIQSSYTLQLTGLNDGTKYYYKLDPLDASGNEYTGTTLSFTTLPRPHITNIAIAEVGNTAQTTMLITWTTNTKVSSIITYYPLGEMNNKQDSTDIHFVTGNHQMIIAGLLPKTPYGLIINGRDTLGNQVTSDPQDFTTATDTRPPYISNISIEGATVPVSGSLNQASTSQLVVTWTTDKLSSSQVEYGEGTGNTYPQVTNQDGNLTLNHLVVISNLTPSKVYHLRVLSKDGDGNISTSIDNVAITPKAAGSALDIVTSTLAQIFGSLGG
jgi:hypothetical protein